MKKLKALLVAVVLVLTGLPLVPSVVRAGNPAIRYQKATVDPTTHVVTFSEETAENYMVVTTSDTSWGTAGWTSWYVVNSSLENTNRITVNGTVNLILCDGKTLTATKGITVRGDNTLNIYGQSGSTGKLLAGTNGSTTTCEGGLAGIGGIPDSHSGTITIHGGNVKAAGGRNGAGIGGGNGGNSGTIDIYGGNIEATGGDGGAGIGGGQSGYGGTINIHGGYVTATGGVGAEGIGRGYDNSNSGTLTVGSTVNVYAKDSQFGKVTGATLIGTNGTVTGARKRFMKAIQGIKYMAWDEREKAVKEVTDPIYDYTLVTPDMSTNWTAGWYVVNTNVTIDSRITVSGTVNLILCDGATLTANEGIRVAEDTNSSTIDTLNIYGQSGGTGALTAISPLQYCAGIGGQCESDYATGRYLNAGTIIINGGNVTATGREGAGIGGGYHGAGGNVTINGGNVKATSSYLSAGIGGGLGGDGGNVTINGGIVTATGGDGAKGIGAGKSGSSDGTLTLGTGMKVYTFTDNSNWENTTATPATRTQYMKAYVPLDYNYTEFEPWTSTNSMPSTAGNYYLTGDVAIGSTWSVPADTTYLCLNGHGIKYTGNSESVITVNNGGKLNLYENDTTTEHKYTVDGDGLATVDDTATEDDVKNFKGGYITGGNGSSGGGVSVNNGTFNMYGGTIIGNKATTGGGVYVSNSSAFYLMGGAIKSNYANDAGGGLTNAYKTMIRGGEISDNRVASNGFGGGIHITTNDNNAYFNISGALVISGNKKITAQGVEDNNVYIAANAVKINIDYALTNSTPIGITMPDGTGVFTNSTTTDYNVASKFVSDSASYGVKKNADGQLKLAALTATHTATFKVQNGKWNDDMTDDVVVTVYDFTDDANDGKLTDGDIPAVGNKPNANYQAGSWDTEPNTTDVLTTDVTYTYAYAAAGSGGGGDTPSTDPTTPTDPTPETPTVDPTSDITDDKTVDPDTVQESTDADGNKVTEATNTDGSTTKIVDGTDENGIGTKTTTVTETDGTVKEQTTTTGADGSVTESAKEEKTNGDFVESTKVTNADGTTEESSASKVTDEVTGTVNEKETTKAADDSTTEWSKETKSNDDFTENFVAKDAEGNVTEQRSASRETAEDGTVTEKSASADANGTSESEKVTKGDGTGDFTESSVTKDAAGNVLESKEASQVTDAETGDVTEKALTVDSNGSMESEKTTKGDGTGDFTESSVTKDAEGNVLESKEASQVTDAETGDVTEKAVTQDAKGSTESEKTTKGDGTGDYTEKSEKKDAEGNVVESKEASQTTDANNVVTNEEKTIKDDMTTVKKDVQAPDGSGSVLMSVEDANGKTSNEVTKGEGGVVAGIRQEDNPVNGEPVVADYAVDGDNVTLSNVDTNASEVAIGDTLPAADGNTYKVTEVGQGAFKGNTNLTAAAFGAGIRKLAEQAMRGCKQLVALIFGVSDLKKNTTSVQGLTGASSKIVLEKNCLKGTSKKLIIGVDTKADKKAVKKQLKKAGNKHARVKVGYRLK